MIRISELSVVYPGKRPLQALSNITLSLAQGEKVALMGVSGCGKSTLLNVIAGLILLCQ